MNFVALHIRLLTVFLLTVATVVMPMTARDFVLVIDPGHGGKDYGAIGKITNEKSINLAVAKLVGEKIKKEFDDVKIVYTRNSDKFISLKDRAAIANKAEGDLFLSIHVNSVDKRNKRRTSIQGASVYTLGLHKSADNLEVAKRENSVMTLEDDYTTSYAGFNPESAESYIIFELSQDKHMDQSLKFARDIQDELISTAGRADRGVRQAGYWVLWATGMPSVLVELDFICNPAQEKFMASKAGQKKMADAIFNAFSIYKSSSTNHIADSDSPVNTAKSEPDDIIIYKIQILTSSRRLSPSDPALKGIDNVSHYIDGKLYKYTVGQFYDEAEAKKELKDVAKKFPAAFIIKTQNGIRK